MTKYGLVSLILLPMLFAGCNGYTRSEQPANHYYLNPNKNLHTIGTVALVELENKSAYPQIDEQVTESLFQAIQKKQIFSLSIIRRDNPAWHSLQLDNDTEYTLKQLFEIRKTLGYDAILTGTITRYQPYPHMTIGLKLRLLDLSDGQLVWAFEQVWDSSDKTTNYHIKQYIKKQLDTDSASLEQELITVSSISFAKFAAYQVAGTL